MTIWSWQSVWCWHENENDFVVGVVRVMKFHFKNILVFLSVCVYVFVWERLRWLLYSFVMRWSLEGKQKPKYIHKLETKVIKFAGLSMWFFTFLHLSIFIFGLCVCLWVRNTFILSMSQEFCKHRINAILPDRLIFVWAILSLDFSPPSLSYAVATSFILSPPIIFALVHWY